MEIQYLNLKLYSNSKNKPDFRDFIPVFHNWIEKQALDELLIDVADYSHVRTGPGVILIAHEANYAIEYGPEQQFGLIYNVKVVGDGSNRAKIRHALKQTVQAALRLQSELPDGQLKFSGNEVRLTMNRRKLVPNVESSLHILKNDITSVFDLYFGQSDYVIKRISSDARERFTVQLKNDRPVDLHGFVKELSRNKVDAVSDA